MNRSSLALALVAALASTAAGQQCTVTEAQHLFPSDYLSLSQGSFFGYRIAADGDRLVVGAEADPGGAVYVYDRAGPAQPWVEAAKLGPSVVTGEFGPRLDVSGDLCVVGTPEFDAAGSNAGAVFVFERDGTGSWSEVDKLFASDASASDMLGDLVVISGNTVASTARGSSSATHNGAVYVFERDQSGAWSEVAKLLLPKTTTSYFGWSLGLEGDVLAVGSLDQVPFQDSGAVYIHERDAGGSSNWGQTQRLQPAEIELDDAYGTSVSLSGSMLAVGTYNDDDNGPNMGAVYVYEQPAGGGLWSQIAKVLWETPPTGWRDFGRYIGIDGDWLVSSAAGDASFNTQGGSGYVFHRDEGGPGQWGEVAKVLGADCWPLDAFGRSVAVLDGTLLFGARFHDHWFKNLGGVWSFEMTAPPASPYCTAGTTASGCQATVSAAGSASRSKSTGFLIDVAGAEGQKDGTLYFGTGGAQANPWGNGTSFQCVTPPVVRTGVLQGSGTLNNCDGGFQLDFNDWMTTHADKAPAAGAVARAQCWFRDPLNTSNQSTSLSDAIEFTVCP